MAKEPFAALLSTIWIGGFVFWMLNLFKGPFSEQISDKYEQRNLIVGFIVQIILVFLFVGYYFYRD